jgi:hypothetical protein
MSIRKLRLFLLVATFLSLASNTYATCTNNGGGSWTTGGNGYADVKACYDLASVGDTINVIAGNGTATWTTALQINKNIRIIGPGAANLRLTWTSTNLFQANNVAFQISGFEFYTTTHQEAVTIFRGTGWRVDHIKYNNTDIANVGQFVSTYANDASSGFFGNVYGVVDSNAIVNGKVQTANGNSGFSSAGRIWYDALNLGTNEAVYVEDNVITLAPNRASNCIDSNRGGKYVFRYNSVTENTTQAHSLQAANERGTRKWEIYGNTFNSLDSATWVATYQRGGTGVIFGNDYTSVVNYNYPIMFDNVRSTIAYSDPDNSTGNGACDGNSMQDGNTDSYGYPCRDQIGRSTDITLWTNPAVLPGPAQALVPVYLWSNYRAGSAVAAYVDSNSIGGGIPNHSPDVIKPDRDYYDYKTSFNGTSGTGCGTLANRPTTCTTGVGYWATTQSCSNLTGMVGANPSTPISGTLYKCTAPNTWTAYYTPYTYPHPLRSSSVSLNVSPSLTKPASPLNLRILK